MLKQKFKYFPYGGTLMPYLPIKLSHSIFSIERVALVDSGSEINVLPYSVGVGLGFIWNKSKANLRLGGVLSNYPAMGVIATGSLGVFEPIRLAFAWVSNDNVRLILGQSNFFSEFHICFYQDQEYFEISSK